MKKIYLLLIILFWSNNIFAQLYYARYGGRDYYVEMIRDSVHLEIFNLPPSSNYVKLHDEFLYSDNKNSNVLFIGKQFQISKTENKIYLIDKSIKKEGKIKLEICKLDLRDKNAHLDYIERELDELKDSLSGPFGFNYDRNESIKGAINADEYLYDDYVKLVNNIKDSIAINILKSKDPKVDFYYNILDSLSFIDSNIVYDLLSKVNFKSFYGKKFIYKLALHRPEYLVNYMDKNSLNKDSLLIAIKDHKKSNEIIQKVKETPGKSEGRREILKQKTKRMSGNIATVGLYGVVVLAELSVLVVGILWLL